MRFLIDQDVYAATTRFLRNLGHDTITVSEIGLAQASDERLLQVAEELERILVTRDRDYGALVFLGGKGAGVIYLRLLPSNQHQVHEQLKRVLISHAEPVFDIEQMFPYNSLWSLANRTQPVGTVLFSLKRSTQRLVASA